MKKPLTGYLNRFGPGGGTQAGHPGRMTRTGFVLRMAGLWAAYLVSLIAALFTLLTSRGNEGPILFGLTLLFGGWFVLVFVQSKIVTMREHDIGGRPWWSMSLLYPPTNFIYVLLLSLAPSDRGTNDFGPDPRTARRTGIAPAGKTADPMPRYRYDPPGSAAEGAKAGDLASDGAGPPATGPAATGPADDRPADPDTPKPYVPELRGSQPKSWIRRESKSAGNSNNAGGRGHRRWSSGTNDM